MTEPSNLDTVSKKNAGTNIKLGPVSEIDFKKIFDWKNDRFLSNLMAAAAVPNSEEQVVSWIKSVNTDQNQILFGIRESETGELIGIIRFMNIDWISKVAEYGMYIGAESARGKSYGRQAILEALTHAFKRLNMHRIWLRVLTSNQPACMLYKSVGFRHEGTLRQHFFCEGVYTDMEVMGLVKPEFAPPSEQSSF